MLINDYYIRNESLVPGRFFEVLVGRRQEPLWQLLSKVGILYTLEPIFSVIFIVNMNSMWEKVMSSLRAQIFQRVLIQKVNSWSYLSMFWSTVNIILSLIVYCHALNELCVMLNGK
mgnify:FL=1